MKRDIFPACEWNRVKSGGRSMTSSLGPSKSKKECRVALISSSERADVSEPRLQNKELGVDSFELGMFLELGLCWRGVTDWNILMRSLWTVECCEVLFGFRRNGKTSSNKNVDVERSWNTNPRKIRKDSIKIWCRAVFYAALLPSFILSSFNQTSI